MKAEEVLNQLMDDDRTRYSIIQAMKEYARIQIEKDRERVKANFTVPIQIMVEIKNSIDNTPINLD